MQWDWYARRSDLLSGTLRRPIVERYVGQLWNATQASCGTLRRSVVERYAGQFAEWHATQAELLSVVLRGQIM